MTPKRILFLMSDTGGGHRASANAISEAVDHLYPGRYETIIDDIWKQHTPWPISWMPNSYGWITDHAEPLWRLLWRGLQNGRLQEAVFAAAGRLTRRKVVAYLRRVQPHLIVSVHPLMNRLGLDWMRAAGLSGVPFVTVVTDMVTFHPTWICPQVTRCIVPTDPAYHRALSYGMPAEKLAVHGQPVSLAFARPAADKKAIRRRLGLDPDRATILLTGGGEGHGRLPEIARQIDRIVPHAQQLIVTGRNAAVRRKLAAEQWRSPTRVYGFVHNMPELMRAADLLITKAGPGTISEAFATGLPALISGYIPGQESGNVRYVQQHGAGAYAEAPHTIAHLVRDWLSDPGGRTLARMAANAAQLARPRAALNIAADVCGLI